MTSLYLGHYSLSVGEFLYLCNTNFGCTIPSLGRLSFGFVRGQAPEVSQAL